MDRVRPHRDGQAVLVEQQDLLAFVDGARDAGRVDLAILVEHRPRPGLDLASDELVLVEVRRLRQVVVVASLDRRLQCIPVLLAGVGRWIGIGAGDLALLGSLRAHQPVELVDLAGL